MSDRQPETVQVLMQNFLLVEFQGWLATRGWVCVRTPWLDDAPEKDDPIPTYLTAPTEETFRSATQPSP